jgi:putative tryptophan/tyrosine transport system substrate-binding protein
MKRREFITLLGSAAATWPLAAGAQQPERMQRIGVLMNVRADDPQGQLGVAEFQQLLKRRAGAHAGNLQIDVRWGANDADLQRAYAAELVALKPDVLLASGTISVSAAQHVTRTLPIVFVRVADPVGAGFVENLARPGGNATGFMIYEYSLSGKWLELLKEIAPGVMRVAILRNPDNPVGVALFGAIQAEARSLRIEVIPVDSRRDAPEIESAIRNFARSPNGGVIFSPNAAAMRAGHKLIIALAAELKLPVIYPFPNMVAEGGLICHAPNVIDQCRSAANYVDRILKGEKPGDLPVQAPTKYQVVINLKTAKALGLTVPPALLAQADEVIE